MVSYEFHYFEAASRGDLPRMLLEVGGASYQNVFVDYAQWPELKKTTAFGLIPKLVIVESGGARKELFETSAINLYLADIFGLLPGDGPFERAETQSVLSSFYDLEGKLFDQTFFLPTLGQRKTAHEKMIVETIPAFLKYQERFVRGQYYFGDKLTVADLKLYSTYLWYRDMHGARNPFETHAAELPKLNRIIAILAKGKAGDYAQYRRDFGRFFWVAEEWTWTFV
ncbi:hypothetical protein EXIGLDRAFT_751626 [Exidia glandulosa HHB12029]|uniref:glutathione transferase n=1 Tax=Exidia glandulosa HHB12029 TaxID=1314781 RepID=A0A165F916_EXIGL|nr:hypothetical protein EXIGLDRAFT_751626 [Exidia glandulosa HHB12029]